MASGWSLRVAGFTCGCLAVLLYLNSLHGDMVFDDRAAIVENYDLRPTSPWSNLLRHDFWGDELSHKKSHKSYRPLCSATFKINFHLQELEPLGYHAVNVVLNALVCYLYVQLCAGVFERELWPTIVSGLLFTVHPIHTEAVASTVGRAELLSSIFSILALLCYTKGITNTQKGMGWRWLAASMVSLFCSLISKEQGITVAALCLTYEFFIVQKLDFKAAITMIKTALKKPNKLLRSQKLFLTRAIAMTAFVCVIIICRVIVMQGGPKFGKTDNPGQRMETPYRQLYFLHLIFANSWLLVNPSQLIHDWRFEVIPLVHSFADHRHLLTILTFLCLSILGLWCVLHRNTQLRKVAFAFSVITLTFLPASNLFFLVGFVVAERVLFLPSMGFCILVAYGAWQMKLYNSRLVKCIVYVGLSILLTFHSIKTINRNRDWNSVLQLYTSALKNNKIDGLMFSNIGYALGQRGVEYESLAEEAHKLAVEMAPNYSQPFRNYGALLYRQERYDGAEKMYRKAVEILGVGMKKRSRSLETYLALARTIAKNDSRLGEALQVVNTALSMQPEGAETNALKVDYLLHMNRTTEAKAAADKVMRLTNNDTEVMYHIGLAYMENDRKGEAENHFRRVLSLDRSHGMAMLYAGKLLVERATTPDQLKEANLFLRSVVKANPNISDAQYGLGVSYLKAQKFQDAETRFLTALSLEPTHPDALYTLSYLYYFTKNYTTAVEVLTELPNWEMHVFNNTKAATVLANCYMELREMEKLKEVYDAILKQNPQDSHTISWLDSVKLKIAEHEEKANSDAELDMNTDHVSML